MSIETNPSQAAASTQVEESACRYTGLSKPECHCQACLRDLVARFGPERRG